MKLNFPRRLGALLLVLALVLPMALTTAWAAAPAAKPYLNAYMLNLKENDTYRLEVTGSKGTPNWISGNPSVATVGSDGTVKAVGRGNTTITDRNTNLVCTVYVDTELRAATSIKLSPSNKITMDISSAGTPLYATPNNNSNEALVWTVTDPSVLRIDQRTNGEVTIVPLALGTAFVNVAPENSPTGASASVEVEVTSAVTSMQFDNPETTMKTGDRQTLYLIINPDTATNKDVDWSSSNPKVATITRVDDTHATVTALTPGTVTITALSRDQTGGSTKRAVVTINVTDAATPTLKVTPEAIPNLIPGEIYHLTAELEGDGATVTWTSSNTKVATVSGDRYGASINCLSRGTATITATALGTNGKKVEVKRTVRVVDASSLIANSMTARGPTSVTLSQGGEYQLAVNVSPSTAYVFWSSDDPTVATVDPASGKVTAVNAGRATITATAQKADGTPITVTFEVAVMGLVTGVVFNTTDGVVGVGEDKYTRFNEGDGRTRVVSVKVSSQYDVATNTYIVWESSDTSIASVTVKNPSTIAELTVPAVRKPGIATITATVYDSTTKKPVMIDDKTPFADKLKVEVSGITLSLTELTMHEWESKSISLADRYGEVAEDVRLEWNSSDPSVAYPDGSGTGATLIASNKGTAVVTATTLDGKYSATCKITVVEDPGTIINAGSAAAGNSIKLGTSSVISQINAMAKAKTKANMDYISSIFISPNQGVVYNTYTSEADTGSGVSMAEKYYVNRTTPAAESIQALSFVPNKSFNGEARITFIGSSQGQAISGIISVNVTGQGQSGSDVTYTTNAVPITFLADDFNTICSSKTGRSLKYVTFTPPDGSQGALYENYTNDAHPGVKVTASTQYNRTGTPNISNVTFVPANGFGGTVSIPYRAVDSSNASYSGKVTVIVNKASAPSDPADISYAVNPNAGGVTFRTADFSSACSKVLGGTLSHVRFTLPPSSDGTLFYNYRGVSDYDSRVSATTSYYASGSPALNGVSFVPIDTSSGRTAIPYTGYSTTGASFTGTVYVTESNWTGQGTSQSYDYTVSVGSAANFTAASFNAACRAATGYDLSCVRFNSLPPIGSGTLFYTTGANSRFQSVDTKTQFYRTGVSSNTPLVGSIVFQSNASFTGVVKVPYTGWDINGNSFNAEVAVNVTPITIYCGGTTAKPIELSSARFSTALSGVFAAPLDHIEFTSLPDAAAGTLYGEYKGYGTGYEIKTATQYKAAGLDQISFVATGRYTGDAAASYTAYSTSGEKMNGDIVFAVSNATESAYFNDMGNHLWAASSVDYLYDNKVTNGMTATTFGPYENILRRDFVLMLYRIYNFPGGSTSNTGFSDVRSDAYYAQAVSAAKRAGIIPGDSSSFRPNEPIVREDAMVMMVNAMKYAGTYQGTAPTSVLNTFPDSGQVSNYAREALSILVSMGAVSGDNGYLKPRGPIARSEAAVLLHFIMTR